jgi:hypothetical protein
MSEYVIKAHTRGGVIGEGRVTKIDAARLLFEAFIQEQARAGGDGWAVVAYENGREILRADAVRGEIIRRES